MTPIFLRRCRSVAAGVLAAVAITGVLTPCLAAAAPPAVTPTSPSPMGITTPGPLGQLTSLPRPKPAAAQPPSTSSAAGPAQTVPGPQLSITVDNGRTSTEPGEVLNYVLTLTNLGSTDVKGLRVTQSVPSGLTLVKADGGGRLKGGYVGWDIDLRAARAATFHIAMKVSATPKDVLRLATVACATLPAESSPIVCASHSDQLPAGAAAAAAAVVTTRPTAASSMPAASPAIAASSTARPSQAGLWYAIGVGGALIVVISAAWLVHRRRSHLAQV